MYMYKECILHLVHGLLHVHVYNTVIIKYMYIVRSSKHLHIHFNTSLTNVVNNRQRFQQNYQLICYFAFLFKKKFNLAKLM